MRGNRFSFSIFRSRLQNAAYGYRSTDRISYDGDGRLPGSNPTSSLPAVTGLRTLLPNVY